MRKSIPFIFALLFAANFIFAQTQTAQTDLRPPVADKKPKTRTIHGDTTVDNYFWLREKTNPEVMDYLKAEDSYAQALMQPTASVHQKLYDEMLSHIKQTDVSAPY